MYTGKVKYPELAKLMASIGMSKKDYAKVIGKAPSAVSDKLSGKTDFKWSEIVATVLYFKKIFPDNPDITSDKIFSTNVNYN